MSNANSRKELKPWKVWNEEMAPGMIMEASDHEKKIDDLANQCNSASDRLMEGTKKLGHVMREFEETSKKLGEELRSFKSYALIEIGAITKALEDLRKFFLSASHEEEMRRLKEFVELCERLNALKDSGFLDKVADTMLKL